MVVPIILGERILLPLLLLLASIWLLPHTPLPARIQSHVSSQYSQLPKVVIDLHPQRTFQSRYSTNKTALYIEPRVGVTHITPLLVHMMEIVPPEWRFVFLGTEDTASTARTSGTVRRYEDWGKLRIGTLDPWTAAWGRRWDDLGIDEMNSRLLTNKSFYVEELAGVEHLFVFHSDAILCANSHVDLNEWLQYDWVGAPWTNGARFGGNGGLSLRRVSKTMEVLQFQKRLDDTVSEDIWLSSRIGLLPGANMADPGTEREFAVEDIWAERPMGYHINPNGVGGNVWLDNARRKMIFEYCPEIKIILDMRLERERCMMPPMAILPEEPIIQIDDVPEGLQGLSKGEELQSEIDGEIESLRFLAEQAKDAPPGEIADLEIHGMAKGYEQPESPVEQTETAVAVLEGKEVDLVVPAGGWQVTDSDSLPSPEQASDTEMPEEAPPPGQLVGSDTSDQDPAGSGNAGSAASKINQILEDAEPDP